jgi:hypothetical protein
MGPCTRRCRRCFVSNHHRRLGRPRSGRCEAESGREACRAATTSSATFTESTRVVLEDDDAAIFEREVDAVVCGEAIDNRPNRVLDAVVEKPLEVPLPHHDNNLYQIQTLSEYRQIYIFRDRWSFQRLFILHSNIHSFPSSKTYGQP